MLQLACYKKKYLKKIKVHCIMLSTHTTIKHHTIKYFYYRDTFKFLPYNIWPKIVASCDLVYCTRLIKKYHFVTDELTFLTEKCRKLKEHEEVVIMTCPGFKQGLFLILDPIKRQFVGSRFQSKNRFCGCKLLKNSNGISNSKLSWRYRCIQSCHCMLRCCVMPPFIGTFMYPCLLEFIKYAAPCSKKCATC